MSTKPPSKKYFCLEPGTFKLDGGAMFGIIPKPLWNKVAPADEHNRIKLALRLWFIQSGDRNILVDTGIGDYHPDKFNLNFDVKNKSLNPIDYCLQKLGLNNDSISDLIISHLHFDHIGGFGRVNEQGVQTPIFKNAKIHLHKNHYEYALSPTPRDSGSFHVETFNPLLKWYESRDQIAFYQGEEGCLIPELNINFKCSHGHTPYLMHPYDENYMYMADLIPTSHHIHIPWVMGYDISPGVTTQDKINFLNFINENKLKMIFEHDPDYSFSSLSFNKDRNKFLPCDQYQQPEKCIYELPI